MHHGRRTKPRCIAHAGGGGLWKGKQLSRPAPQLAQLGRLRRVDYGCEQCVDSRPETAHARDVARFHGLLDLAIQYAENCGDGQAWTVRAWSESVG